MGHHLSEPCALDPVQHDDVVTIEHEVVADGGKPRVGA
jgi:hypothetical protein